MARRLLRSGLARPLWALADRLAGADAISGADQWQRVVLNRAVDDHLRSLHPERLEAAEISGTGRANLGWAGFISLEYPGFDLCAPLAPEHADRYDVVVCEQVLEHVVDPGAAAANLTALCRPGGHVVVSTPFLIRIHELPHWGLADYWRFTPRGLQTLLERAGLEVGTVGTWGNRDCVLGNLDRWPAYRRWHSLHNEPDLPVQVWAFARRPEDGAPSRHYTRRP
jgi:SAM-dependent methyltransferase